MCFSCSRPLLFDNFKLPLHPLSRDSRVTISLMVGTRGTFSIQPSSIPTYPVNITSSLVTIRGSYIKIVTVSIFICGCSMDERSCTDISTKIDVSSSQPNHIPQKKAKRPICQGCNLPSRTCICTSLPEQPLHPLFQRSRIIVLQHPHEFKRKNRSMVCMEVCIMISGADYSARTHNIGLLNDHVHYFYSAAS